MDQRYGVPGTPAPGLAPHAEVLPPDPETGEPTRPRVKLPASVLFWLARGRVGGSERA